MNTFSAVLNTVLLRRVCSYKKLHNKKDNALFILNIFLYLHLFNKCSLTFMSNFVSHLL